MTGDRLLVAGLGNPGAKYEKTRHNAGFLAVDHFAVGIGERIDTDKMQGVYAVFRRGGKQVFLLKPQTYMNRSGECILQYARYFDIQPEHILVVHDDLDLDPGRVKMVSCGGAGGHNGILSTISHLGTKNFSRIKIGIGHPDAAGAEMVMPVEKYVLSRFTGEEWEIFQEILPRVEEGIQLYIERGIEAAMNRINTKAGRNGSVSRE